MGRGWRQRSLLDHFCPPAEVPRPGGRPHGERAGEVGGLGAVRLGWGGVGWGREQGRTSLPILFTLRAPTPRIRSQKSTFEGARRTRSPMLEPGVLLAFSPGRLSYSPGQGSEFSGFGLVRLWRGALSRTLSGAAGSTAGMLLPASRVGQEAKEASDDAGRGKRQGAMPQRSHAYTERAEGSPTPLPSPAAQLTLPVSQAAGVCSPEDRARGSGMRRSRSSLAPHSDLQQGKAARPPARNLVLISRRPGPVPLEAAPVG